MLTELQAAAKGTGGFAAELFKQPGKGGPILVADHRGR
jgi:hypothetical protein